MNTRIKYAAILFVLAIASCTVLHAQATAVGTGIATGAGQWGIIPPPPPQYPLTVLAVTGVGTVTAVPNGVGGVAISCPPACVATYVSGTVVTLTETPGSGQTFSTWGGACAGSATTCVVTMTAAMNVTAAFTGGATGTFFATLPRVFVNSGSTTHDGICSPPAGVYNKTITLSTLTVAGLQAAMNAWGTDPDEWELLKIPHGTLLNSATFNSDNALVSVPIKVGATKCLVIDSDTPIAPGTMVCSHGLPLPGQGTQNPGCTNDISKLWTLRMDDNSVGHAGWAGIFAGIGANHFIVRSGEITVLPGSSQSRPGRAGRRGIQFDGDQTGRPISLAAEAMYVHGWDPGDPGQPSGACGLNPGDPSAWKMSGTVALTNGSPAMTYASGNSFGPTFPGATIVFTGAASYTVSSSFDPGVSDTAANLTTNFAQASGTYAYTLTNPPSQYAHGCGDDMSSGIVFNCDNCWAQWNYIEKIHLWGAESHAMSFGFSSGPNKINQNWIQDGAIGLFSGGGPVDTNGGPVNDVEIIGNYLGSNLGWRFLTGSGGHSPHPNFGCGPLTNTNHHNCPMQWAMKNRFEFKLAVRAVVVGNIFDVNWADGQPGNLTLQNVRVCSGGQTCGIFDPVTGLPLTAVRDILYEYNWYRNSPEGPEISTRAGSPGNGGGVGYPSINFDYWHNVFSNIGDANQFGSPGLDLITWGTGGNTFRCAASRTSNKAHMSCKVGTVSTADSHVGAPSNVTRTGGNLVTVSLGGQRYDPQVTGTVVVSGSSDTSYNTAGTPITGVTKAGVATLCTTFNNTAPQPCIKSNGTFGDAFTYTSAGTNGTLCSSVATCATTGIVVTFPSMAYSITDMAVGDNVYVPLCASGSSANSCHGLVANHDCLTVGGAADDSYVAGETSAVLAVSPTLPASLDVYYPNVGPDDNSGTICSALSNQAGFPKNASFVNNTIVSVGGVGIASQGPQWKYNNNVFKSNIFAVLAGPAGNNNNVDIGCSLKGEGSNALNSCWNPGLLTEGGNVLLGRAIGDWSSFGGGAANSVPANVTCALGTADPTCIGFTKFMSGVAFPSAACAQSGAPLNCPLQSLPWADNLRLTDLALVGSTSFPGTGADITAMLAAMVANIYICPASCGTGGTLGPYHD